MLATASRLLRFATHEGATVVLQLNDGGGRLAGHVVNSVLVTKPIGTLHGVVHVPSPVVLVHVSERGVDTTLGGHGVGTRGEKLGDTSGVESSLGQTEGGAQTGTTRSNDDSIVLVVLKASSAKEFFLARAAISEGTELH